MIYLKRLVEDSFEYRHETLKRQFPEEYLLALDETESHVIGYAKLNLLTNQLLAVVGPADIQPELRQYVKWLFQEMGERVMTDVSGTIPIRIDLAEEA